ncbi:MAG: SufE family protein [Rhodobacteraceae bacterium]|nr:SufE family protein [Paracoccaceae bacterium]
MPHNKFSNLVDDFTFLETWEDRYGYIIDLGKQMPELEDEFKVDAAKVEGCASQVWLVTWTNCIDGEDEPRFQFKADSDAFIVRGLIAILKILFNGLPVSEVVRLNAVDHLNELGLDSHLTPQRSNGLRAMVNRIKQKAESNIDTF